MTASGVENQRPRRSSLRKPMGEGKKGTNIRRPEAVVAGLPAQVMDELVDDLAEAVVAMLLSQAAIEPDDDEHASGDLRKV